LISIARFSLCVWAFTLGTSLFGEVPEWARKGKPTDSTYKYYVGRSSGAANEQAGFSEATREAYEQAIRENFGFRTRIQSDAYESSTEVVSTKRVQVLSQDIRVFGFEQVDFYQQIRKDKVDVWVLYRYPLAEISRERSRLAAAREEVAPDFSESGSAAAGQRSGVLEVQTKPAGASVFVDGQSYGVTPLRLRGVLEPGPHTLRVDHPNYMTVDERIVLVPGQVSKVDKTLVPALAKLAITTEPSNANVVINGKQVGVTPVSDLQVTANESLKLEITHAEASPLVTTLEVAKDEFNSKHFVLPLKSASLTLRTQPTGAEVAIDGESVGFSPVGPKALSAGKHELRIRKAGYQEERLNVLLRGGEKRVIDTFALAPSKGTAEPSVWAEYSQPRDRKKIQEEEAVLLSAWVPQFRSSSTDYPSLPLATWGVSTTLLFGKSWGVELGYAYGARGVQYSDARSAVALHRIHFAIPFFFAASTKSHFYVGPEIDFTISRFTLRLTSDTADRALPTQNQFGYGLIGGYRKWWDGWGLGGRLGLVNHGSASVVGGSLSYLGGVECFAIF
jgi:hypothetical protein